MPSDLLAPEPAAQPLYSSDGANQAAYNSASGRFRQPGTSYQLVCQVLWLAQSGVGNKMLYLPSLLAATVRR